MALWIPTLLWTGLIALLSSPALSGEVTRTLVKSLLPWIQPSALETVNWLIRKGGHVTEYAVLTALWDRAFRRGTSWSGYQVVLAPLFLSLATACLDELHQAWVPNRTGSVLDVLLDGTASGLTQWGLVRQARGGSFLWSVTGAIAWIGVLLGTLLLALNWTLHLPTGALFFSSVTAGAVLLVRRYWKSSLTRSNRLG